MLVSFLWAFSVFGVLMTLNDIHLKKDVAASGAFVTAVAVGFAIYLS